MQDELEIEDEIQEEKENKMPDNKKKGPRFDDWEDMELESEEELDRILMDDSIGD